ncbi:MAG: N,N-dimethylformamidase [Gammaproteobacteria bacterium]|jgi:N,N-dimethylformamidase
MAIKLTGYSNPLTSAPGQTVEFMVGSEFPEYHAEIVRLIHGDLNPSGPGLKTEQLASNIQGAYPGRVQSIRSGSSVIVEDNPVFIAAESFTFTAWIYPTTPDKGVQGILGKWDEQAKSGFAVLIDDHGGVALRLGDGKRVHEVKSGAKLLMRHWYFIAASFDASSGSVQILQQALTVWPHDESSAEVSHSIDESYVHCSKPLLMAACHEGEIENRLLSTCHYNGKLEAPTLFGRALTIDEMHVVQRDGWKDVAGPVIAAWNFARDFDSAHVYDESGNALHGCALQMPARAMTGHAWSGDESNFKQNPAQYGAIHFHDDDLEDAHWDADFTWQVPADLPSGIYAAHVQADDADDYLPVFVCAKPGQPSADIAFLVPTASYLAYANDRMLDGPDSLFTNKNLSINKDAYDYCFENNLLSTYDLHADGSGVCYSSTRRPLLNMRPGFYHAVLDTPHQFPADLHLVDWLEAQQFSYDVITDHLLHETGKALLEPYRTIVTGTHPEYWSHEMLDALQEYLNKGGRLVYIGGNGFYWVTSFAPGRTHAVEIRRADGIRAWEHEPGELYHNFSGERGGLWRWRGRAPQQLAGVGFSAQGYDTSSPYRRQAASYDPRAAFIFEGIEEEVIGDFESLVMRHGAAGFELDRFDHALGTPAHALLLASSFGHSDSYQHVIEEVLMSNSLQGGTVDPRVRADMVFFEYPNGGAVFSTGSIAWSGALSNNNYRNNVSAITANVLRNFSTSGPLPTG